MIKYPHWRNFIRLSGFKIILAGLLFLSPFAAQADDSGTRRNAQEGTVYSPTMGWVKTSSAQINPVTDYYEAGHQKAEAEAEAEQKEEKEKKDKNKQAERATPKRRVLVA